MTRRQRASQVALGAALFATAAPAMAGPTLITTRPATDPGSDDVTFFAGGINEAGRSLKASSLELIVDGQPAGAPASSQALSDWATVSAEASQTWRPPLAVGLVYLWVEGVPSGLLDGIHAFFQRVPSRTVVYPTIYGRMRQGRARLAAADVSRLDELGYLESYRPNAIEAVRLDLADLAADRSPLRILVLITDGRDFSDPKGEEPGDFSALGRELRKAGVTPLIVAFPAPEADAVQAAANLRDLHESAGGLLRSVDQVEDLENALESLGQALADLQRVQVVTPWSWRVLGGSHRLSVRLTTVAGQRLTAEIGTAAVGPGSLRWLVLALAAGLVVIAGLVIAATRRRPAPAAADEETVLAAAHDLIRRGTSPERAVEELTRGYPDAVGLLVEMDPELLSDPRFPYFRTRPGRQRLQEIRDILGKKSTDRPALQNTLASSLATAVQNRQAAHEAAATIAASVAADEWMAFAGLNLEQLAEALRAASRSHPSLGTPRARGAVVAIQDALRAAGGGARGISVAWLVRAGGPGRRGETLRLPDGRAVIGQSPACAVRISADPAVAAEHAEITTDAGAFTIAPLGGALKVEGQPVDRRRGLTDGETIEIGAGLFVFKAASVGNLAGTSRAAGSRSGGSSGDW